MKIEVKYTGKILNLPHSVAEFAPDAGRDELLLIIELFANPDILQSFDTYIESFSERLGLGIDRIKKALGYWEKNGVIAIDGVLDTSEIISSSSSVPTYTGEQIKKFVEKNEDIRSLFNTCQAILGKEFNTHDHNNIIFLKSYYKFGNDFIMLLLAHCKELDKANWQYIRKTAKNLYDEGIDTYSRLEAHFADRKNKSSLEYKIRELFEIGKRELSKSEREKFDRMIGAGIDIDFIKAAYDITVDKTGKASLAYCAKIIENWLSSGLKTVKDVEAYENRGKESNQSSSFDTNDFFEAALLRSYKKGDKK